MGMGQMMLTIGAMALLGTIILTFNRINLETSDSFYENKYMLLASSLATSIIEEAYTKSFDECIASGTVNSSTINLTKLSTFTNLKKDAGENYKFGGLNTFDDFDDYNGLVINTASDTSGSVIRSADFLISCKVFYVDPPKIDVQNDCGSRTWHKKMIVTVVSDYVNNKQDTIKMSKIRSYYWQ